MKNKIIRIFAVIFTVVVVLICASCGAESGMEETSETTAENIVRLPDFSVYSMEGKKVSFYEKQGKPMIINFWATWCPPCCGEMPAFDNLYAEYKDRIEFMMINLTDGERDTEDGVREFLSQNGYSFPVYFDSDMSASYTYGVQSIPTTVFVNAKGELIDYHTGAFSEQDLRARLEGMISK